MAKQPDPNNQPAKSPDAAAPEPLTPQPAPASPMPPMTSSFPNMSLDDSAVETLDVEEVLEDVVEFADVDEIEEIPVLDTAPMDSAVVAVSDVDILADDVFDIADVVEVSPMDSAIVDAAPGEDSLFVDDALMTEGSGANYDDDNDDVQVVDSPVSEPSSSRSDVELLQMFEEEPAVESAERTPTHVESFPAADLSAVTGSEMPALAEEPISQASGQIVADDPMDFAGQESLPAGGGALSGATSMARADVEPVSDVHLVEAGEIAPVAETPISDLALADLFDEPFGAAAPEAVPASAVEAAPYVGEDEVDLASLFDDEVAEAVPASAVEAAMPVNDCDADDDAASLFAVEANELTEAVPASAVETAAPVSEADIDLVSLFAEQRDEPVAEPAWAKTPEARSAIQLVDAKIEAFELAPLLIPASGVNEALPFADESIARPDAGPSTTAHVPSDAALRSLFGVKEPSDAAPEVPLAPRSDVQAKAMPIADVPLSMNDLSETTRASGSVSERPLADDHREIVPSSEVVARAPVGDFGATIPLSGVGTSGARSAVAPASDILFPSDDDEFPATPAASPKAKADTVADEIVEVEPSSSVLIDDGIEDVEEAAPESDVLFDAAEEADDAVPKSSVFFERAAEAFEETEEEIDEVVEDDADIEEADEADDDIVDAVEEIDEVEDAAPASDVLFESAEDEIVEAVEDIDESADDVLEAVEDIDEIDEAAPSSGVVFDEAVEDLEDEADEVLETVEDVDEIEAGAAASDVLFDAAEEEVEEAVEALEEVDAEAEADDDSAVFTSEDYEKSDIGSSSVFIDDTIPRGSSASKASASASGPKSEQTQAFGQTIAFQPISKVSSQAKNNDDDDMLVTEEELDGAVEASAVDPGEMPPPKGSSAQGIDKLAEALESGLDVGARDISETDDPEPGVVFDEILDDETAEPPKGKGKEKKAKLRLDDGTTETDSAVVPTGGKGGTKAKKVTKATGDDIDLDAMFEDSDAEQAVEFDDEEVAEAVEFDDEEVAEAVEFDDDDIEAAEAFEDDDEEAEAAEAFDADEEVEAAEAIDDDEEAEAAEAIDDDEEPEAAEDVDEDAAAIFGDDDIAPPKKGSTKFGKKTRMHEDEEPEIAEDAEEPEEAAAFEDDDVKPAKKSKTKLSKKPAFDDDDEDYSASAKKGPQEKAVPATKPASGGSTTLRIFVGMFLMAILLGGSIAGAIFGLPDESRKVVEQVFPPPKAKPIERWVTARAEVAQGKYKEAAEILKDASDANELGVRGEAVWLEYYGRQKKAEKPLDENAPEVKSAKKDLADAKATVLLAQIVATLEDQKLTAEITKMKAIEADSQKQLDAAKADKVKADKAIDALAEVFVKGKYIDDKAMFDVTAIEKILKSLGDDKTTLDMVNKLLEDAKIKDKGDKGVAEIITDRNAIAKDRDDVLATLAAAFKELIDGKVVPDKADPRKEIVAGTKKLTKDRDDLFDTLLAAFKELVDGKIVPEKADARKEIVAGTKLARQKAESPLAIPLAQLGMSIGGIGSGASKIVEQTFDIAKVFSELGYFKTREPFIQTPEQKLDTYITLLQDRKQNKPQELDAVRRETDWVDSTKSKADDEARTKARFVLGLTLRNEERFAEAGKAFSDAAKLLKDVDKPGPWSTLIAKSHREIVDPTAYFLPRIDKFQADGNLKAAIDEANLGLKAMPEEARLFAQRGLLRFETIRGKGPKLGEVAEKAIREDAETAAKDVKLIAESAYILGLLEEELGKLVEAEKQYRQALKMHQGLADDAGRYRVALARLLLRDRPEVDAPAAPKLNPDEKKKEDKAGARLDRDLEPNVRVTIVHPLTHLVVAAVIGQPVPEELEDKETLDRLRETIKIAEELINEAKNPKIQGQGYLLRGSARSKLGDRTAGLKDYATGLKLVYPGIPTSELTKLIEDHPAFQQPDSAKTQNPVLAERHFGEGIHYYWAEKYPQAEIQFKQAVKYFERDARYQYYLGLAMLQQRTKLKRDAAFFAFDKGAQLEAEAIAGNPFVVSDINQSLERIQGELRQFLNGFRYKAQGDSAVK
ncbi:MAG: hypothetical protein EXS16_14885 [Gemmataceae bacterium]|nr:hypothetical protein [Gemmataceae bacterium]